MKKTLVILAGCCVTAWAAAAAEADKKAESPKLTRAQILEKYDKNKDGKLDETERAAMKKDREAEMLKKYDKNGDGKLDAAEKAAAREDLKRARGTAGEKKDHGLKKDNKQG